MSLEHAAPRFASPVDADRRWGLAIGGRIVDAQDGATFETRSPADGTLLGHAPFASRADVDRAVAAALRASRAWRTTPLLERIACVRRVAEILRANADEVARLDAIDGGNPLREALKDVRTSATGLEYQASVAFEVKGDVPPSMSANWMLTRREPYGVVGRIGAYNHPLMFTAWKLGPPVLMGNTIVIKAPEQAPLSSLRFAELIADVFPAGVVNILTGDGPTTGDALVRHPRVKRLGLIGSVPTAMRIQRSAAEVAIKHISLELGGKNAMIVFPDADLERVVQAAAESTNIQQNAGQSCGSITRLFLHEAIHDEVLARLVERLGALRCGHPLDPATDVGPLVSHEQLEKVLGYVAIAKAEGAKLVLGGKRPSDPELRDGYFVEPTVFDAVTTGMRIAREEVFGPILSVLTWRDRDAVVRAANDVEYGLTGSVFTRDLNAALEVASELDTGYVWINGRAGHFLGAPFAGHKNSGLDSEESIAELYSYTESKTVNIALER